jgi:hypothetical protein
MMDVRRRRGLTWPAHGQTLSPMAHHTTRRPAIVAAVA